MPNLAYFQQKQDEWMQLPRPKSCDHRPVHIIDAHDKVGCFDCGFVVSKNLGEMDPVIYP